MGRRREWLQRTTAKHKRKRMTHTHVCTYQVGLDAVVIRQQSSERSDVVGLPDRRLPNGTSTSEVHLGHCKSVILENYKWCSKSRVSLCQQWGLTRKTWTQYPPRGEKKETHPYLHQSKPQDDIFICHSSERFLGDKP